MIVASREFGRDHFLRPCPAEVARVRRYEERCDTFGTALLHLLNVDNEKSYSFRKENKETNIPGMRNTLNQYIRLQGQLVLTPLLIYPE